MNPAERFARLPDLLAADADLRRRGRWLDVDCRIDIGAEPFHLAIRQGALVALERGPRLMRAVYFSIRGTDEAWRRHWRKVPEPVRAQQTRRDLDRGRSPAAAAEPAVLQGFVSITEKSTIKPIRWRRSGTW